MFLILFMMLPVAGLAYCGWHLWVLLPLPALWKAVVVIVCTLCFLSLLLDFSGSLERMPLPLARVLYKIGTSSVIVLLYVVMAFLLLDIGRLVHLVPKTWLYQNWVTTAALTGLLLTLLVCGNINYNHKVRVPITLSAPNLPHDVKVVMLSDLHLGYHNTRSDLSKWVDLINAENPDLILIAGDIIDISTRPLIEEGMAEEFRRLKAPVLACPGNHEYYARMPKARQFYQEAGISLLIDSGVMVANNIFVIGRDDRGNSRRKSLRELLPFSPLGGSGGASPYTIVMDHQPYHLEEASAAGIDFQLSGHTHRGQVWPISWITDALYDCSWGEYQHGNTRYYVSSGIGIWGGKFRIGTQSEYIVATLKSETAPQPYSTTAVQAQDSCTTSTAHDIQRFVAGQLLTYPQSRLLDIYKSCFQDFMGAEHLVTDRERVKAYLDEELESTSIETLLPWYYEPCGIDSSYYRVSLRAVKEGLVTEDLLLDAFIRSANATDRPTVASWSDRWHTMMGTIDQMGISLPHLSEDKQFIDSILHAGKYAISHSPEYREAYHPHYRIVERSIFETEIKPLIEPY